MTAKQLDVKFVKLYNLNERHKFLMCAEFQLHRLSFLKVFFNYCTNRRANRKLTGLFLEAALAM